MKTTLSPQVLGGIALLVAAVAGMVTANTPFADLYGELLSTTIEVRVGEHGIAKPLLLWVNDGLMAVFFLLVALELKREILDGELSRPDQIGLPLAAAIGGIAVPAGCYLLFNASDEVAMQGWAIPAATDIAFALGVLAMLGSRVPAALAAFLLSVAVFDDLGAILIIATLYTDDISWTAKGLALVATAVLVLLNLAKVRRISIYLLVGVILWVCVLKSGVHATLAGVIVGLTVPHRSAAAGSPSPLLALEHSLQPWVAFAIVPLFAFANSGVSLAGLSSSLIHPVTLGISIGLFLGKMIGVFGAAILMVRLGWARLPQGATWTSFFGVCILTGIGFTMSLFIGTLAFEHTGRDLGTPVRLGVLVASLLSALVGFTILRLTLSPRLPYTTTTSATGAESGHQQPGDPRQAGESQVEMLEH